MGTAKCIMAGEVWAQDYKMQTLNSQNILLFTLTLLNVNQKAVHYYVVRLPVKKFTT